MSAVTLTLLWTIDFSPQPPTQESERIPTRPGRDSTAASFLSGVRPSPGFPPQSQCVRARRIADLKPKDFTLALQKVNLQAAPDLWLRLSREEA